MSARSVPWVALKMLAPAPSGPSRPWAGTRQPSRCISPIGTVRSPILACVGGARYPGVSASTTNAEMPQRPACGAVLAKTMAKSATGAKVTSCFTPVSRYASPSRSARILSAKQSEPASGSVMAKAPMSSPRQTPGR